MQAGSSYSDAFSQIGSFDYPNWSIGLNFAVPIFNRTAKANAAIAATDLELARTNLALLKQNLSVEVRTAARNVDTARRSVAAAMKVARARRAEPRRRAEEVRQRHDDVLHGRARSRTTSRPRGRTSSSRSPGYLKSMVAWHKAVGDLLAVKNVEVAGLPVPTATTAAEEGAHP